MNNNTPQQPEESNKETKETKKTPVNLPQISKEALDKFRASRPVERGEGEVPDLFSTLAVHPGKKAYHVALDLIRERSELPKDVTPTSEWSAIKTPDDFGHAVRKAKNRQEDPEVELDGYEDPLTLAEQALLDTQKLFQKDKAISPEVDSFNVGALDLKRYARTKWAKILGATAITAGIIGTGITVLGNTMGKGEAAEAEKVERLRQNFPVWADLQAAAEAKGFTVKMPARTFMEHVSIQRQDDGFILIANTGFLASETMRDGKPKFREGFHAIKLDLTEGKKVLFYATERDLYDARWSLELNK